MTANVIVAISGDHSLYCESDHYLVETGSNALPGIGDTYTIGETTYAAIYLPMIPEMEMYMGYQFGEEDYQDDVSWISKYLSAGIAQETYDKLNTDTKSKSVVCDVVTILPEEDVMVLAFATNT